MKRFCALLTAFALSLSGCYDRGGSPPSSETGEVSPSETEERAAILETVTVSEESETAGAENETVDGEPEEPDDPDRAEKLAVIEESEGARSALDLIGFVSDGVNSWTDSEDWREAKNLSLFRTYFFGTWENADEIIGEWAPLLVLDDSEQSFFARYRGYRFGEVYEIGTNVLAFTTEGTLFWIDRNDPEYMYAEHFTMWLGTRISFNGSGAAEGKAPVVLTKTAAPPNEPEENFLSVFKLFDLSREYGIDDSLLTELEWGSFYRDNNYNYAPIYLVSEAPKKLVLKTTLENHSWVTDESGGAVYTLEKVNGEWVRTIEFEFGHSEKLAMIEEIERETGFTLAYSEEDCCIFLNTESWETVDDYDLVRRTLFGIWEVEGGGERIEIDDSEQTTILPSAQFYRFGEDLLGFAWFGNAGGGAVYWLRLSDPSRLYQLWVDGFNEIHHAITYDVNREGLGAIATLKKTAPPNEPENGFLSPIRLKEIARDYEIDDLLLTKLEWEGDSYTLYRDNQYHYAPIYLVSEAPEKLVLKTTLENSWVTDETVGAVYTLEKVGGEWERTVEYKE